jgi:hypothetical protein
MVPILSRGMPMPVSVTVMTTLEPARMNTMRSVRICCEPSKHAERANRTGGGNPGPA